MTTTDRITLFSQDGIVSAINVLVHVMFVGDLFYMPVRPPGRRRHYVLNLSVHQSICPFIHLLLNSEHNILKTSEPVLMPIGTSGPQTTA